MFKTRQDQGLGIKDPGARAVSFLLCIFCLLSSHSLRAQQPQPQPVFNANSKAVQGVGPGGWIYGADVNIYVATTGNDSTGNGTAGSPYLTIGRALQDVPMFVAQHYVINLAAGTYRETVNVAGRFFGTSAVTNLKLAAIELKGDPSAPDSYVISGADAGAPTTPVRKTVVQSTYQNFVLNGVSLQYGLDAGFLQRGGNALIVSSTFRHFTAAGATALWTRQQATTELRGSVTVSDIANGIQVDSESYFFEPRDPASSDGLWGLFAGTELASGTLTITGVTSGVGLQAGEVSMVEFGPSISIIGTGVPGSVGVEPWDTSEIDLQTATISGFDNGAVAASGILYIGTPTISNANIGVVASDGGSVGWFSTNPVFTSVTTPYSVARGGRVHGQNGVGFFDGLLTSLGAVSVSAGGTNQDITLAPSGTGNVLMKRLAQTRFADQFPGADAGAQITACMADLPPGGGVCDAQGLVGTQMAAATITIPPMTTLLLGGINLITSANPGIAITVGSAGTSGRLIGLGGSTVINYSGSGYAVQAFTGNAGQSGAYLYLENFTTTGTSSGLGGIRIVAFNGGILRNIGVRGFSNGDGFRYEGVNNIDCFSCNAGGNKYGIHFLSTTVNAVNYSANSNNFFGGNLTLNTSWGIYEDAVNSGYGTATGNQFNGITFELNGTNGSSTTGQAFIQLASSDRIENNYFEAGPGTEPLNTITIGDGSFAPSSIKIIGNSFISHGATNTINNVNGQSTVAMGNSEAGSPTNFFNNGAAAANPSVLYNYAPSSVMFTGTPAGYTITTPGTIVNAGTCASGGTVAITGLLTSSTIIWSTAAPLPATWQTGITVITDVSTAGTAKVWLCNPTAGNITPAALKLNIKPSF